MSLEKRIGLLESKITALDDERVALIRELNTLKSEYQAQKLKQRPLLGRPSRAMPPQSTEEKVQLFLDLFRARQDVYPRRWENSRNQKAGYSPVCLNEWAKPICEKPKIKCSDCKNQRFATLDESAADDHLRGKSVIGTYAIRSDDSCVFLACDFDETSWQMDVATYRDVAHELGVEAAVERSRSGNGAHAWIFFEEPIPARLARSLGTLILAQCSERNLRLSLESYDRFFPSQDCMPKGGFGNLIALPLQKSARENGNSCFVDTEFNVVSDQWAHLSGIRKLSLSEVRRLLEQYLPRHQASHAERFEDVSWLMDNSILSKSAIDTGPIKEEPLAGKSIEVEIGPMIAVPVADLPLRVVAKLKKTSSFANPEFYKLQRMRMQTYPHKRFIFSGELRPDRILLPRGVQDEVLKILSLAGASVVARDGRIRKRKIDVSFNGHLTDQQLSSVKELKKSDIGILCAPPGSGKTVMGCALIAERKVPTLILVHRQPLLEQWIDRASTFLGIPPKEIGVLRGTKKKLTGRIDIAMLQSLTRKEDLSDLVDNYAQIIIDECHHIPATSFEDIMRQIPARYVVGLTATPYRKDGLEKILFQQCGPIRHEMAAIDGGLLTKAVLVTETGFRCPDEFGPMPGYTTLLQQLTLDQNRNKKIAESALSAIREEKFPLLISDRKEHLDLLSEMIGAEVVAESFEIIKIVGDLTAKQRRMAREKVDELKAQGKRVLLIATSSLIGEGFDLPELDTLILATPLSFEGRMIQYAGRIHRLAEGKSSVKILDFVDASNPMLLKMYRSRKKAYRKMGYEISEPDFFKGGAEWSL